MNAQQTSLATFWEHVTELRKTLLSILLAVAIAFFIALLAFRPIINTLLPTQHPSALHTQTLKYIKLTNTGQEITHRLNPEESIVECSVQVTPTSLNTVRIPHGGSVIITRAEPDHLKFFGPLDGITATFKICLWAALIVTSPYWLYMILLFIAPALKRQTKKILPFFWTLTLLLFFSGLLFSHVVTIPWANHLLTQFNATLGENLWGFRIYLDYTLTLMLGTALSFESATILFLLVHKQIISPQQLSSKRRHAIVGIFTLSALLTPPDIFTQVTLAVPLIGLYELVILYGKSLMLYAHKRDRVDRDHQGAPANPQQ